MRVASIGIGSNSLRMLVADILPNGELKQVLRDREGLRVFASLSNQNGGSISSAMCMQAAKSIFQMKEKALDLGASKIHLFATSATRDASNKDEFLSAIYNNTGLQTEIISGLEEAQLSFIGASYGVKSCMIDIGGGSTEFALGSIAGVEYAHSFQIGAVRLARILDINTKNDIPNVYSYVKDILITEQDKILQFADTHLNTVCFGVGGTFTNLGAFVSDLPWSSYDKINDTNISKQDVMRACERLADMSTDDRQCLKSIQKNRADIIVHGIAILYTCMDMFNIDNVCVSTRGNLEGYIINKYNLIKL